MKNRFKLWVPARPEAIHATPIQLPSDSLAARSHSGAVDSDAAIGSQPGDSDWRASARGNSRYLGSAASGSTA